MYIRLSYDVFFDLSLHEEWYKMCTDKIDRIADAGGRTPSNPRT